MTIRVIENAGFCFGVSRAIDLLNAEIEKGSENLYTLGEIIHNPDIIKDVTDAGVRIINDVSSLAARRQACCARARRNRFRDRAA